MNFQLRPLFAAAAFVTALYAPGALASLIVSGTTATATIGMDNSVNPAMSVLDDGLSSPEVTLSAIESWDFKLDWGSAPLTLDKANSKFKIGSTTYNGLPDLFTNFFGGANYSEMSGTGFYTFSWADITNFTEMINLAGGFEFIADFDIGSGATAGTYPILFSDFGVAASLSSDGGANQFEYSRDPSPMQVVLKEQSVPEPGILVLLVGGLGALGVTRLLRRNSQ